MDRTVCELFAGVGGFRCGLNSINTLDDIKRPEKWETVWFSQWEPAEKSTQYAHDCYDKVETLDNIDSTVSLEKYDRGYVDREYRYNCENKENSMITYGEYLVENGYMRYTDEFASVCYVKEYRMDEVLTGHHIVEMSFAGNKLVIEHFIIESDDLNEEYWRVD